MSIFTKALAFAQAFAEDSATTEFAAPYDYSLKIKDMIIGLAIIMCLLFFSVYVVKRLFKTRTAYLNQGTDIKILEKRALSPKSSLYLVSIYGKGLLIAESTAGVRLIDQIASVTELQEHLERKAAKSQHSTRSFFHKLRSGLIRNNK